MLFRSPPALGQGLLKLESESDAPLHTATITVSYPTALYQISQVPYSPLHCSSAGACRVVAGRERERVTRGGAGAGAGDGESEIRVGAVRVGGRSFLSMRMHPKLDAPDVALPHLFACRRGCPCAASPLCYHASVYAVASRYARGSYSRTAALDYSDLSLRHRLLRSAAHGGAASSSCYPPRGPHRRYVFTARVSSYDVPPLVPVAPRSHILPPLPQLQPFRRRCGLAGLLPLLVVSCVILLD
ncbi:hypothetical protein K438DRAFT_414036 [Mycena galopus ATCC 62051]|nr:hypothetical protein K438DRAFT_414036 [Mycena galopus ATCC 62051]